ncbi:ATP-dependent helicase [Candidatus Woesearchaeota archaeon]|nr:ATP-dependent helicase [Candidatus Woesearchaeota archaeon]
MSFVEKPFDKSEVEGILCPTVKKWFFSKFLSFSIPQLFGIMRVHSRENVLLSAPTGGTKTLTAFLAILNELVSAAENNALDDRIYAVYISPLKALNNDIAVNLVSPLKEMMRVSPEVKKIRVAVRTGDTSQSEKAKMLSKPPHILITTPESLAIVLSSIKFKELLKNVEWCIIDEIHALAENKRGTHLSLSLERLQRISPEMCRIGLSATVAPLEEVAKFLVGERECKVAGVQFNKSLDVQVLSPTADLVETSHLRLHHELYTLIDSLVQQHKTTIIFTNTRSATERVVDHLKQKFPGKYATNIGAHHGSLSKTSRHAIENRLRKGELKVCVSSTSLELGIDIGYVDLVICLGSPKSVARFLQRAGRAGHKLHETIKARLIVLDRDDLIECSVLVKNAREGKIDRIHIPKNALDVLAQHILGMVLEEPWEEKTLYSTIKKSYCYHGLTWTEYEQILDYLSGGFASLEDRNIFARIYRENGRVSRKGKMSRVIYMTNIGTIPDESHITVKIDNETVGMLDEQFVERLKPGDIFLLGGEPYEFRYSRGMVAQVKAATSKTPTVPSWFSEMLPLSFDLALEIGRFKRLVAEQFMHNKPENEIKEWISSWLIVDKTTTNAIYSYIKEQYDYCKMMGTDKNILLEYNNDKTIFHTLFGRRTNDCLSRAVAFAYGQKEHRDIETGITDNGFYIAGNKIRIKEAFKMLKPEKLRQIMEVAIEKTELFKRRFRHCATRSLMILRNYKGHQKRVGRQQVSSMILMKALQNIDKRFFILQEAKRECLEDVMDIENSSKILNEIRDEKITIKEVQTELPSPFAFNLALQGAIDVLKIEDKHEFIRRMHELIIKKMGKKEAQFSYNTLWEKEQEEKQEIKLSEQEELRIDALKTAKTLKLPGMFRDELLRMIDGEKDLNYEFTNYLDNLLKGAIPKAYSDKLIKHIIKQRA